jgi:predicted lactoylglutathione lyase
MTKDFWVTLAVRDVHKSREFYQKLGFAIKDEHSSDEMAAVFVSEKSVGVMLFKHSVFQKFTNVKVADPKDGTSVIYSIDAESPQEVRDFAAKVEKAGGRVFGAPGEKDGWMYGCGFTDLDGHCWAVVHMDFAKMPKR